MLPVLISNKPWNYRWWSLILYVLIYVNPSQSQKVVSLMNQKQGVVELTPDISIPKINSGYTLWLPESGISSGLIVFTHPRQDTANQDDLIAYALTHQLAVLYATTENRLDFFFDTSSMLEIEEYIHQVIAQNDIPPDNLFYCGMSLEGTRALKLTIFGQSEQSKHQLKPKGIVICDAPLDMVRFHKSMVRAKNLKYNPVAANEGSWVSGYLEKNLIGSPEENLIAYIQYSPYCHSAKGGPYLEHFKDIAVRAYTEPDVQWWMEARGKDYYDMNAIDLAAFINVLKLMGNKKAELITTHNEGYLPDGIRHPHSWTIVNEKEMVDWFIGLIKQ